MTEPDDYFVHALGVCESRQVGAGTRVWAFTHILPGARIGKECNLCDHVFVENDVHLGDRVTIKSGVQLWDGIRLEDDVFVGPNATFTNDPFPRSKRYPEAFAKTVVERAASIGANATLLPGVRIGMRAMVGAGAVVTRDVPPNAIVVGNPARIVGYVQTSSGREPRPLEGQGTPGSPGQAPVALHVGNCQVWPLPRFSDMRGDLVPIEFARNLPFVPKRQFFVFSVPGAEVRGEHAHRKCEQFLIAVSGALSVVVDDGQQSREVRLDCPEKGLYLPAGIWGIQYKFTRDAVLAVYASLPYAAQDYIRDYQEFQSFARQDS